MPRQFRTHRPRKSKVGREAPESRTPSNEDLRRAKRFRSSARWQRKTAENLEAFPLCCDPFGDHEGQPEAATCSHHIEPVWLRFDLRLRNDNLASLCNACHGKTEAMERAGKPTRQLFKKK